VYDVSTSDTRKRQKSDESQDDNDGADDNGDGKDFRFEYII